MLVNRNDDRLHMLVAPTFARRQLPDLRKSSKPRRILSVVVKPLQGITHGSGFIIAQEIR